MPLPAELSPKKGDLLAINMALLPELTASLQMSLFPTSSHKRLLLLGPAAEPFLGPMFRQAFPCCSEPFLN
jgi:hypothetical protein